MAFIRDSCLIIEYFSMKILITLLLAIAPLAALAQEGGYQGIDLQAPIPGLTRVSNLGEYIAGIYRYSIAVAAILAGVMITIGGLKWLTAAGNAAAIGAAKKTIGGALIGLILVSSSYVILNTINPELVKLRVPAIRSIPRRDLTLTLLGAANCDPGSLGCTCRGNDPETPNACNAGLRCVSTRFIFATDESAVARDIRTGAVVGAGGALITTRSPHLAIIAGTTGVLVAGISSAGQTLYKCTDGRDTSPCDDDEDCQSRHCQEYYHVCYRPPVEMGGICNDDADCASPGECEDSSENIVEALGIQGTPEFCRGQGGAGDRCRANADCARPGTCLKPPDPSAFGRCRVTRAGQTEKNDPCVLTNGGGITPPACLNDNPYSCYYCPTAEEGRRVGGRFWTRLDADVIGNERRVGQCKIADEVRNQRCAD